MKSPTKILTVNSDGKCEKIQLFYKLTDEFQITEIKFESLDRRTITKETNELGCLVFYDEYGKRFQRSTHISEIETFSRDKVVYKIIETTVTRIYFDGIAETVESIQIDRCPENSFFKIRRELTNFIYNENHQIVQIRTENTFINKDDVPYGTYHCTDLGEITWWDFTNEIKQIGVEKGIITNKECKVNPCTTDEYPTPAKRPAYSVLSKDKIQKTLGIKLPDWKESLSKFLNSDLFDRSRLL